MLQTAGRCIADWKPGSVRAQYLENKVFVHRLEAGNCFALWICAKHQSQHTAKLALNKKFSRPIASKEFPLQNQKIKTLGAAFPDILDNVIPYIGGEEEKSEREPLKLWVTS